MRCRDFGKERASVGVLLLLQIGESQVQEQPLIVRSRTECLAIHLNRLRILVRAGVDDAQVAERAEVAWLRLQDCLKALLSADVILGGESLNGLFKGGLKRVGGN